MSNKMDLSRVKDEEKLKYEEINIPTKLRRWAHSLSEMEGFLLPGQDMCNHFSVDLAKGRREKPPTIPPAYSLNFAKNLGWPSKTHVYAHSRHGGFSRSHTSDLLD